MDHLCECGCGKPTNPSTVTDAKRGYIKGEPHRFVQGHNTKGRIRNIKPTDWTEEDRGYKTPCWIWNLSLDKKGYGRLTIVGKSKSAHRYVWELLTGQTVPEGFQLDHLCRVPSCVRPDHCEAVTREENLRRGEGISRKTARTGICHRGHSDLRRRPNGRQYCVTCQRERDHARRL